MLAVVFGIERFHHNIWENRVTVYISHKLLELIAFKNLALAPPRQ